MLVHVLECPSVELDSHYQRSGTERPRATRTESECQFWPALAVCLLQPTICLVRDEEDIV